MKFNIWVSGFCFGNVLHYIIMGNVKWAIVISILGIVNLLIGLMNSDGFNQAITQAEKNIKEER